jgi:hypothetical protein
LAEVAADRPHVAQRRCADDLACFGKHWKPFADDRTCRDVRHASRGSDAHISGVCNANLGAVGDPSQVNHYIGQADLFSDGDEKIRSTTERDSARLSELFGGVEQ